MNNSSDSVINNSIQKPLKICLDVGSNIVVVIDKSIVQKLGISENDTLFEEEITEDGILLRIKKIINQESEI